MFRWSNFVEESVWVEFGRIFGGGSPLLFRVLRESVSKRAEK